MGDANPEGFGGSRHIGGIMELPPEDSIGKQAGHQSKQLEVGLVGPIRRNQDDQDLSYGLPVRRMDGERDGGAHEYRRRRCNATYPGMRNGEAVAERGRPGLLAPAKGPEDRHPIKRVRLADRPSRCFKRLLAVMRVDVKKYFLRL